MRNLTSTARGSTAGQSALRATISRALMACLVTCGMALTGIFSLSSTASAQTITCPSNITVNAANGQCAQTVSYSQPTSTLGGTTVRNFNYTGGLQSFVIPAGVTSVQIECWGGQGRNNAQGLAGGRGGFARGNLAVSAGQTLRIYVGGGGGTSTSGHFNGGGNAGVGSSCATARGGGGGGASDVRLNSTALSARRIVAGGGGGAGGNRISGCGRGTGGGGGGGYYGGGGGAGWPFQSTVLPRGGSQTAGGAGGTSTWSTGNNGFPGGLGNGGNGGTEVGSGQSGSGTAQTGGTGGGTSGGNGLYSVNWTGQSGAGGSGYIGGVTGGTMSNGSRSGNGLVRITYTTAAVISQTAGQASGTSYTVGTTTNTFTDGTSNCSFTVTVVDNQNPSVSCPSNVSVNAANGQCSAAVSYSTVTAADNCSSLGSSGSQTFDFTGGAQTFTVPAGVTSITVQAWGAQGGNDGTTLGGRGGFATGNLAVTPGQVLNIYVGGKGTDGPGSGQNCNLPGGFNGGGNTGSTCCSNAGAGAGAGGGGSDVRVGGTSLANRRIVAGGGGGSGSNNAGAVGGGLTGGNGQPFNNVPATGGSQTAGGNAGGHFTNHTCSAGSNGTLGAGGRGDGNDGGGGGGGYYGGGGGANNAGGGGGSSYVGGVTGGSTQSGQRNGNGRIILTWMGSSLTLTQTAGLASGATYPVGTTANTYRATDASGNQATCTFSVTVNDNQNPAISCPANVTVNNTPGNCSAVVSYSTPAGTDNCPSPTTARTAGLASGSAFPVGTTTTTYRVTDASGNTAQCSFSVTVNDNQNPAISCPANVTVNNDPGQCSAIVQYSTPGGTDNCPNPTTTRTAGLASGAPFPVGTTANTYRVTDAAGNTAQCSFSVTVNDNENPALTCPTNITVNNAQGQCSATVQYSTPGGTDNCPGVTTAQTAGLGTGSVFPVGTTTETYAAADAAGNTASCSFTVTVVDNENPALTCPNNISVNAANSSCDAVVSFNAPVGTDNCPGVTTTRTAGQASGSTFSVGASTVTYTSTDASGNSSNCSFTVTVVDNQNPTISCPANISVNNDAGNCSAVVSYSAPGGVDNCPGAVTARTTGLGSGAAFPVGTTTETYTVTDGGGNTANCAFSVTVSDNENPAITCPSNISVNNDPGNCSAIVQFNVPAGTDNCPGANTTLTAGQAPGSAFNVGTVSNSYTVTDAAGNTASCSFTVTVTDNENPNAQCNNFTVQLGANGTAAITASAVNNNSTDNCGIQSTTLNTTSFTCANLGANNVNLTVLDVNGNSSSCIANILVEDNISPTATCQNITLQLPASGDITIPASQVGGASTDNCAITTETLSQSRFTCANIGTNTVSYMAMDASGNSNSCTATVTVVDTSGVTARMINLGADTTICNLDTLTLDAGSGFATYVWSTGNTNQTQFVNAPGSYSVVATDTLGCVGQDTFSMTVDTVDNPNIRSQGGPAIVCLNDTLGLEADSGYVAYAWSTGGSAISTSVTSGGNFFLTVTAPSGCTRTDTFFVDQRNSPDPNPIIDPQADTLFICDGGTIELNVRGGYAAYEWSSGDTSQMVNVNAGDYWVTVTNGFGCWNVSAVTYVRNATPVVPAISVNGDTLCSSTAASYQWFFNGNQVLGATNQCIVANSAGSYYVQTTDAKGCDATSDTLLVVSAAEAAASDWAVNAYPNPFSESTFITFEAPENTRVTVDVYSLTGVLVKQLLDRDVYAGENVKLEFKPQDVSQGIYIYRLVTESGRVHTGKLILQQ